MSSSTVQKGRSVRMAATRHLVLLSLILGSVLASQTQGLYRGDSEVDEAPQIRHKRSENLQEIVEEMIELLEDMESKSSQDDRMVMADSITVKPNAGWKEDEWSESSSRGIPDEDDLIDQDMRWCDSEGDSAGRSWMTFDHEEPNQLKKGLLERRAIIPGWNDKSRCDHHECFKDIKTWPAVPYYLLNDANFLIDWPTRYLRIYYIFNYNFYTMMDKNITAIEDWATEAISIIDKAYKTINFRVLLVGVKVLTERWPGEGPKPNYNDYLKPKVREYVWNTIRPEKTFHTAVYIAGPPHWDAVYAGAGMGHLCKVNGMNDFPYVMAVASSKRPVSHYWNAHEIGHEFRNGHNFDPSDDGSSICPAKRLFGTKCVMGGNSYPTTFSSTFIDKIKATNYSCMSDKPPQEDVFRCGNGILDAGEECDCGNSQSCITSDPCCDGQICKLKQSAECSANNPCCKNCKVDLSSCSDDIMGRVKRAAAPPQVKSYNRVDIPPGVLAQFPAGTTTPMNRVFNWLFEAPAGLRVTLWLAIPPLSSKSFDVGIGCPFDWIEVRDGEHTTSPVVGRFCTPTRKPIVSSGTKLLVTFRSDNSFDSHFLMKYSFFSTAKSGQRWRDDGRCGWQYPAVAAASGQCAPDGETPCCSSGRCRSKGYDCTCLGCVDYRNSDNKGMPTNPASAIELQSLGSECYEDMGGTYRGTASTTLSGKTCQAWSSQTPNQHSFNPATYPNLGLDNNYCRNPDLKVRPWCHSSDPKKKWEYCMLSKCTGPASRADLVYMGCYKDTSSRTFPGGKLQDPRKMTSGFCINHCSGLGYSYAATQYTYSCFCGNEANFAQLEPARPESECNRPCAGNMKERCGGTWRNSVYKIPSASDGWSCGDGFKKFKGRCYKAFTEKKPNEEAKNECASTGGRLAAPKTAEIQRFLVELAKMKVGNGQAVWIGLQRGEEQGVWKYSDGSTLGECTYSNWAPGEPKVNGNAKCGQYWAGNSYMWDDTYCSDAKAFICETGPPTCPDGYEKFGDTCYKVFTERKAYRLAHATCANDGGTLAAPKTAATNAHLANMAKAAAGRVNMWIGVDNLNTGVFKYSDGTPLKNCKYTNWAPNEPGDRDCVQYWAGKGYKWDDTYCTDQKMFICQIGPGDSAGCC
ncbi:LPA [Branchiostoma lanceolatum]|uniref:Kringle-containing protein marking the eye and the nose n=1 Tax=Branchiostoma lanceolatum TaxID=7740 RepID=A0A8J9YWZ9_BRALA|nr:LPA [Branchiostoma lanceolatum]